MAIQHDTIQDLHVGLEITRRCTMRCPYCYVVPEVGRDVEFKTDWWIRLMELIKQTYAGRIYAHLAGGEIFLKEGISDLILWLADQEIPTTVVTNGLMVPEPLLTAGRLKAGTTRFRMKVSLDGLKSEHEQTRRHFDRVVHTVEALIENGIDLSLWTTVHSGNLQGMSDFHYYLDEFGSQLDRRIRVEIQPVLRHPRRYVPEFERMRLPLADYLETGIEVTQQTQSMEHVETRWRFVEDLIDPGIPPDTVPLQSALYGCSTGVGLEINANGDVLLCEMDTPVFTFSEQLEGDAVAFALEETDRRAVPRRRCLVCTYKTICGMCRLTPILHGYTAGFGYQDCQDLMRDLIHFYEAYQMECVQPTPPSSGVGPETK